MEIPSLNHYDNIVLLFIYFRGFSYFNEITRLITNHPQRTYRIMKRLERLGLIETDLVPFKSPNGKIVSRLRVMVLTPKGKEYVETKLLPRYQEYKEYIAKLLDGTTS